jgi:hypothetical protein
MFFIFCTTDGWWGNSEALRAAERGKSVDFVLLLYIIRLYLSLLFRRQAGIEYNYLLCIIASGCFFLAQVQHGGGGWSANIFFTMWVDWLIDFFEEREKQCANCGSIAKSVTEKNNSRADCAEAGKKTVQAPLRQTQQSVESADLEIRGGDSCQPGIVPAELHGINYQAKPDRVLTIWIIGFP